MKCSLLAVATACCLLTGDATAQTFRTDVAPLVESSCLGCHDASTKTRLNFEKLSHDLGDPAAVRQWEKVFDRVSAGEMPPPPRRRPDAAQLERALGSLRTHLRDVSLARQQRAGRVPARRLTKLELGYTLRDLFRIEGDVTNGVPDEVESGSFDTVGADQRISAAHLEGYLKAADEALDRAIALGPNPCRKHTFDYPNNSFLNEFHDKPLNLGGNVSRKLDDGVALFRDVDYLITSLVGGFQVRSPGVYRITSQVAAFQSDEPITFKLIRKEPGGSTNLLTAHDLEPGKTETVVVTAYLATGDAFYSTFALKAEPFVEIMAAGGAKKYKGKGLAIKGQTVEGPLSDTWPPRSTTGLLHGAKVVPAGKSADGPFKVELTGEPIEHIGQVVREFAARAFRRPPTAGELDPFVDLARPALDEKRAFVDTVRVPLRAMLGSPQFLLFGGKPGKLDGHALANRLSYFLWKSMPDDELFALAAADKLSDPAVLARQVDRMLADPKADRFIRDFLGQWLRLNKVNATTPDDKLYPEYDEVLGDAIPREPELFFADLIGRNLNVTNLIDSDFTYLNRRLAAHYGVPAVGGQHFRRVALPKDSPRGGVLTTAAVLKTTANGTVTSPVMRGNFVLSNVLGTPPSPPPPGIGSIEPDTRGKTTIREILEAHRNSPTCNKCHRAIDPPGFALESFDPIGGFRARYRAHVGGVTPFGGVRSYRDGPAVDPSGLTADGQRFSGVKEFKQLLLGQKEQIARHFVSRLVVYATGGEIQFADREEVEAILARTRKDDYPVRDLIHAVVQSRLFRNK